MRARSKKWLIISAIVLVIVGSTLAFGYINYFDRVVVVMFTPATGFDQTRVPDAPSYIDDMAWSALPTRLDAADVEIATLVSSDQARVAVDVFYVHPTSFIGREWNARIDDKAVNTATDQGATRIQASVFNACCAIYAPRYRQANLTAFINPSVDGEQAIELAGTDVLAAFQYYLEHYNQSRPFILAAHSQGSIHALRLLKEVIVGNDLRQRLVVAYLIGGPFSKATIATIPGLHICAAATDTGCIVGWNARSPTYTHGIEFVESSVPTTGESPRICVNPLTWLQDEGMSERTLNQGALFFDVSATPPAPRPGFANARCQNGFLITEIAEPPPRDFMSRLLDHAMGDGNYHPIEYGIFFVNLRENAQTRIETFLRTQTLK